MRDLDEAAGLVDDDDRRRIATDLGSTLFVEAGAGTGKTHALVERVVELVRSGRATLGQIAAITFTDAAAAELHSRLAARLEELAAESPADERIRSALGELDDAVVTTIHGFAQRICAEHPLEAGLPLRIRVLDDFEAEMEFDRRFSSYLDELLEERGARDVVAAALVLGITPRHLAQLAREVDEAWEVHSRHAGDAASGEDEAAAEMLAARVRSHASTVRAAIDDACGLLADCTDGADTLAVRVASLAPFAASYDRDRPWRDLLGWLIELPPVRPGGKGAKARWSRPVQEVREVVGEYETARRAALGAVADAVLRGLLSRLGRAAGDAALARRRAGELRYHDLLVTARDLLAGDARVRGAVQRRYVQVLVDEFQDTDALQLEILFLVAGGSKDHPGDGRLFFVGDPKQAIYRFRGADVALYESVRREVVGDATTSLVTSFRSVPGVLDWVNRTFAELLGAPERGERRSWRDLAPRRAPVAPVAVSVLGGPTAKETARERRALEAQDVASAISRAVLDGWPVADEAETRPLRFGDVALLVPRRTGLDELQAALDSFAVPYRIRSSSLVYGSTEVRDLLACLRAVGDPGDERALVAALRTPELACGDDDLLDYRRLGGAWRVDVPPPSGCESHPVALGLAEIGKLHAACHELGVAGTLDAIVVRWRALQLASGTARSEEAWRRILLVVDQARAFVAAGGASIAELIAWADHRAARGVRVLDPADEDDDAVHVLTIHGAKGLEFPVVVLADLGSRRPPRRGPTVLVDGAGSVEARVTGDLATAGYAAAAESDDALELEEQIRLCYVAATRARDHLVVSLRHTPAGDSAATVAELLWDACSKAPETWSVLAPRHAVPPSGLRPPVERRAPLDTAPDPESVATWSSRRRALLARLGQPSSVRGSDLEAAGPGAQPTETSARSGAGQAPTSARRPQAPALDRRDATSLGRAVHGVLERADISTGHDIARLASEQALAHDVPTMASEIGRLARAALETTVVRQAAASGAYHREVPVAAPVGRGIVEGVVDLCFTGPDGLVVVDYKTDVLARSDQVANAARRYRLQLGAYALALELAVGRPVARCVLLFLSLADGAVEHDLEDLAGAVAAARDAVQERLAPK